MVKIDMKLADTKHESSEGYFIKLGEICRRVMDIKICLYYF